MEHNREPRIYPHIHIQLIFYKGANAIEWEKSSLLTTAAISTKGAPTIRHPHGKKYILTFTSHIYKH